MAEETRYHGLRTDQGWLMQGDLTMREADDLLERHLHGANLGSSYWLEVEDDHLLARFDDRDQPGSSAYPGNNSIAKDGVWRPMRGTHSNKRQEYPNP
ncbi:MAG: hypothetical protein JWP91_4483 [Fibrobacteres bacterium]|nr:hypothetical protein [Fibrobacterota bacterium]